MIYSVTHMILSYKSPRHCFSYVVITRYFCITCKCIFYLKVGRENYHHNAQRTRLRSTCPRRLTYSGSFVAITRVENKTFGCAKMEYMIIFDMKPRQALASSSYFFTLEAEANSYRFSICC